MPPGTNSRSRLKFGLWNYVLLGGAVGCLALGYYLLSQGSTGAAPVLLVLGYCVLFPAGLAWPADGGGNTEQQPGE